MIKTDIKVRQILNSTVKTEVDYYHLFLNFVNKDKYL